MKKLLAKIRYENARDHLYNVVRNNGYGTAQALEEFTEASDDYRLCTYRKECNNFNSKCHPDTCRHIDKFYRRINRP